ncbi:MAG: hypothetical protein N2746_11015 [Deltaproteobacteria bacterium]|nr:hypothetical protein [Deltaproteobacteria bacterium]
MVKESILNRKSNPYELDIFPFFTAIKGTDQKERTYSSKGKDLRNLGD